MCMHECVHACVCVHVFHYVLEEQVHVPLYHYISDFLLPVFIFTCTSMLKGFELQPLQGKDGAICRECHSFQSVSGNLIRRVSVLRLAMVSVNHKESLHLVKSLFNWVTLN